MMAGGPGPGTAKRSLVTPRSVSSGPQRMHQIGGMLTPDARFSLGGSSTRGSTMGVKATKDSRPLGDKAWQKKAISEIIYFLDTMNYVKALSQTDFPLNSTDFKGVFDFLVKVLIPLYEIQNVKKLELELPPLLKSLGYNGSLSKSCFQVCLSKSYILYFIDFIFEMLFFFDRLLEPHMHGQVCSVYCTTWCNGPPQFVCIMNKCMIGVSQTLMKTALKGNLANARQRSFMRHTWEVTKLFLGATMRRFRAATRPIIRTGCW